MNKHITHLEDSIRYVPINKVMNDLIKLSNSNTISVKIDGSPSILFGKDSNGFFIATKSLFSASRKRYNTLDSILALEDKNLARKLSTAFLSLRDGNYNCIYQADIITFGDDGILAKPNIVEYSLDKCRKDFLISIHTAYDNISSLNEIDLDIPDWLSQYNVNNLVYLSDNTNSDIKYVVKNINYNNDLEYFNYINSTLNEIESSKIYFERAFTDQDIQDEYERFISYMYTENYNHLSSLKSVNGISRQKDKLKKVEGLISNGLFKEYIKMYSELRVARKELFHIYNDYSLPKISTYPTIHFNNTKIHQHEGFVYTNGFKYKIVNREIFSKLCINNSPYKK